MESVAPYFIQIFVFLLALATAIGIQVLVLSATQRLGHSLRFRLPLTPKRRVSHLLCDSDDKLEDKFFYLLLFGVLGASVAWRLWAEVPSEREISQMVIPLSAVKSGFIFFETVVVAITIRYGIRNILRVAISEQINEEQRKWDPNLTNPKVFVIKRDIAPDAVELFHRLTLVCYERGISVLQYTNVKWPRYTFRINPRTGNSLTEDWANPSIVKMANAVVWLDIGDPSEGTKGELDVAYELHLNTIRLQLCRWSRDELIIGTVDGMPNRVRKKDAPEYVGDLLLQILRRHR